MDHIIWGTFLAFSNLGGMYIDVPCTVVTPSHTPWDRLVGSFQLTTAVRSTFYAARSLHYRVFPEAEDLGTSQQNATLGLDEMLKQVMEQYAQERNLTANCLADTGDLGSIQAPQTVRIQHRLFGKDLDFTLEHDSAEMIWTVWTTILLVWISLLLIISWCIDYSRKRRARLNPPDQSGDHFGKLLTKNDVVNLLRSSRLSIAQEIKDDMSHDIDFINERIVEVLNHLHHFEGNLKPESTEENNGRTNVEVVHEKDLAERFSGHLEFCSIATDSILEMLAQMKRRVDHKIEQQCTLSGIENNEIISNLDTQLACYQSDSLAKDDANRSASALEKRIIEELERWLRENIAGDVLKQTHNIDGGIQQRISEAEIALAQIQQKVATDFVGKDQLEKSLGGFKQDIESLRASLSSLPPQGTSIQIEEVEEIVNARVQTLNERLQSIDSSAPITLEGKERITKDINNMWTALDDLKRLYGLVESKFDYTITEEQLNKILEQKTDSLLKDLEQTGDEVSRLRQEYKKIQNIVDTSGIDDIPLAEELERIQNTIEKSMKDQETMRKEVDSHARKHTTLEEVVLSQKTELQEILDQRITNVTRNIMRVENELPRIKVLEGQMVMQKRTNRETWSFLEKCMNSLEIPYSMGAAHLSPSSTTDQIQKSPSSDVKFKTGGNAEPRSEVSEGGSAQAEVPDTVAIEATVPEVLVPKIEAPKSGVLETRYLETDVSEISTAEVKSPEAAVPETGVQEETPETEAARKDIPAAEALDAKNLDGEAPADNDKEEKAVDTTIVESDGQNDETAKHEIIQDETSNVPNPTKIASLPEIFAPARIDWAEDTAELSPIELLSPRSKEPVKDEPSEESASTEPQSQPKIPISEAPRRRSWAISESLEKDKPALIETSSLSKTPISGELGRLATSELARKDSLPGSPVQTATSKTPISGGLGESRWATSGSARKDSLADTSAQSPTSKTPTSGGLGESRWATSGPARKDSLSRSPAQPATSKTPTSGGLGESRWASAGPASQSSRRGGSQRGRKGRRGSRNPNNNNLGETF